MENRCLTVTDQIPQNQEWTFTTQGPQEQESRCGIVTFEATGSSNETLTVWGPQKHEWESHSQKTIETDVGNSQPWNLRKQSGRVRAQRLKEQVWQSLPRNHRSSCAPGMCSCQGTTVSRSEMSHNYSLRKEDVRVPE